MPDYSTLELCKAAYQAARAPEALDEARTAWEAFSIREIEAASTAEEVAEALHRCPYARGRDKSQAAEFGLLKWKGLEEPLVERTKTFEEAVALYRLAPRDSWASQHALELWHRLSLIEALTAHDLAAAKVAYDRSPWAYRPSKARKLAKKKWDMFAMTEAQSVSNHEQARTVLERTRPKSPAWKFLIEKFCCVPK